MQSQNSLVSKLYKHIRMIGQICTRIAALRNKQILRHNSLEEIKALRGERLRVTDTEKTGKQLLSDSVWFS